MILPPAELVQRVTGVGEKQPLDLRLGLNVVGCQLKGIFCLIQIIDEIAVSALKLRKH